MKVEDAKAAIKAIAELHAAKTSTIKTLKDTKLENWQTKRLWREGNKSNLIKLGLALVAFPEPTPTSEIIGAGFIAAGAVQKGIKSRAIYMEDITKNLSSALKEIANTK
jgi:hypothetical protein